MGSFPKGGRRPKITRKTTSWRILRASEVDLGGDTPFHPTPFSYVTGLRRLTNEYSSSVNCMIRCSSFGYKGINKMSIHMQGPF